MLNTAAPNHSRGNVYCCFVPPRLENTVRPCHGYLRRFPFTSGTFCKQCFCRQNLSIYTRNGPSDKGEEAGIAGWVQSYRCGLLVFSVGSSWGIVRSKMGDGHVSKERHPFLLSELPSTLLGNTAGGPGSHHDACKAVVGSWSFATTVCTSEQRIKDIVGQSVEQFLSNCCVAFQSLVSQVTELEQQDCYSGVSYSGDANPSCSEFVITELPSPALCWLQTLSFSDILGFPGRCWAEGVSYTCIH